MQLPRTARVVVKITIIMAVVELFVMLLLQIWDHSLTDIQEALVDTAMLVIFATPMIIFWVIRPYVVERNHAFDQITHLAHHDHLTHLPNRRLLTRYIQDIIRKNIDDQAYHVLLLIDLDDFKPINDQYGHEAGDAVLVEVASRMQHVIRDNDVAGRVGGDEFLIVLCGKQFDTVALTTEAEEVSKRIRSALVAPIQYQQQTLSIGCSIGIRILTPEDKNADKVIQEADIAMYQAKQSQKGSTIVFVTENI